MGGELEGECYMKEDCEKNRDILYQTDGTSEKLLQNRCRRAFSCRYRARPWCTKDRTSCTSVSVSCGEACLAKLINPSLSLVVSFGGPEASGNFSFVFEW